EDLLGEVLGGVDVGRGEARLHDWLSERMSALRAELRGGRDRGGAARAGTSERSAPPSADLALRRFSWLNPKPVHSRGASHTRPQGGRETPPHPLRDPPACRRSRDRSSRPMSPPCGFGTVSTMSSRTMNWCRPPEKGPSNPRVRRPWMSFRRGTGPHGGI